MSEEDPQICNSIEDTPTPAITKEEAAQKLTFAKLVSRSCWYHKPGESLMFMSQTWGVVYVYVTNLVSRSCICHWPGESLMFASLTW